MKRVDWALIVGPESAQPIIHSHTQLFDKNIFERPLDSHSRRSYGDNLALVPLSEAASWRKRWVKPVHLRLLKEIKAAYNSHLFSINKLYTPFISKQAIWQLINVLWAHGYVEKWVAGEYNQGGNDRSDKANGRWHGVHYRVVEDVIL